MEAPNDATRNEKENPTNLTRAHTLNYSFRFFRSKQLENVWSCVLVCATTRWRHTCFCWFLLLTNDIVQCCGFIALNRHIWNRTCEWCRWVERQMSCFPLAIGRCSALTIHKMKYVRLYYFVSIKILILATDPRNVIEWTGVCWCAGRMSLWFYVNCFGRKSREKGLRKTDIEFQLCCKSWQMYRFSDVFLW